MINLCNYLTQAIATTNHINIQSGKIEITENNTNNVCKKVVFNINTQRTFAFTLDIKNTYMFPFFNKSLGIINKSNDGIIIIVHNNTIHVLLVELKSNVPGDFEQQLKNGKSFVKYLIEMINITFKKEYVLDEKNIKSILMSTRKVKHKTGFKRTNVQYLNRNGLQLTEQQCNKEFYIQQFI